MSTDGSGEGRATEGRAGERRWRRYRRATVATLAALALAAGGLGAAAVLRGPRLDSAALNLTAAITRDGTRLVLHADQPLAAVDASQVTITPATDFTLEPGGGGDDGAGGGDAAAGGGGSGTDITLAFTGMLDYATSYVVRVKGVDGVATGLSGTLEYRFDTPDVSVHTLLRRGGSEGDATSRAPDQVLRSTLAAGPAAASEVVFEAPRIQQYAVTDPAIAAIVVDDEDGTSLAVSVDGRDPFTVHTPAGGRLQNLHSSPSARLFGFTVNGGADASGRVYQNALFVYDPLATSGRAEEVTGFEGQPLRVVAWSFVPGSSSLVAQGVDQQLYLIDPLDGAEPVALGRHVELRGFLPGGLQLVVADGEGTSTIDLASGAVEPLPQTAPDVDPAFYPKKIVTGENGVTIRQYDEVDYSAETPISRSVILQAGPEGTRELYSPSTPGARVRDFCVSPNGQYLAVETIPSDGVNDGYALPGYSGMTTYFVDIATGTSNRGVPGFLPDWCG